MGFFNRLFGSEKKASLDQGLAKSKQGVMERISRVFTGKRRIDDDLLEDLEEALILSDVGVDTTEAILGRLRKRATWEAFVDQEELMTMLREEVLGLITKDEDRAWTESTAYRVPPNEGRPHVIMIVGVNGVGKTTSIAKLAHRYKSEGLSVMLGAADTFRAYVAIMTAQIEEACQAAAHVVVVFDEPDAMTMAKRSEQRRRDVVRQARVPLCSEELVATITDDNFSTNDLNTDGCSVKLLMEFRKARPRFYDAVCVAVMNRFRAAMEGGVWSLTFDGVDMRGAERGFGVPRDAGVLSSDDPFWQALLNREAPIGEGDLKLTDVTQRVHCLLYTSPSPRDATLSRMPSSA